MVRPRTGELCMTSNAQRVLRLLPSQLWPSSSAAESPPTFRHSLAKFFASGGCWMGRTGAPRQVYGPPFCQCAGGSLCKAGARVEPATSARLGDIYSVPSTSRSGTRLHPAAGRGIEPAVPLGTGKDGRPTRAKVHGQQRSTARNIDGSLRGIARALTVHFPLAAPGTPCDGRHRKDIIIYPTLSRH